jgi:hypothetical protein
VDRIIFTALFAVAAVSAEAQTYTVLKSFGMLTNMTGIYPYSQLVQGPDGTLYGTASSGEGGLGGTVFKVRSDGTGFAVLKCFTTTPDLDGAKPYSGLVLSGSTLYGTTSYGGSSGGGTLF